MVQSVWERCKVAQTRIDHQIAAGFSKLVSTNEPKLLYFTEFDPFLTFKCDTSPVGNKADESTESNAFELDVPDKLPPVLAVRRRDIFFYFVGISTYIFDVISDCFIVYYHYINDRVFAAFIVSLFVAFPSILLNLISYLWWKGDHVDSEKTKNSSHSSNKRILWILACVFQMGPIRWHLEAIYSAMQFRKISFSYEGADDLRLRWFCRMIAADRDAALLRFFEAFLESVPQLVVQGFLAANYFWNYYTEPVERPLPVFFYVQLTSTVISVLSVSYSISVQHRTLRITRPDKINMELWETAMQLCWRFFTILARFICIVLLILCYGYWTAAVLLLHIFISMLHIIKLQTINHHAISPLSEFGIVFVNSLIHTFAPFNISDSPTRWKYTVAYILEALENSVILVACIYNGSFNFPFKCEIALFCIASFSLGITFMMSYYGCCHPSRRARSLAVGHVNDEEDFGIQLNLVSPQLAAPLVSDDLEQIGGSSLN